INVLAHLEAENKAVTEAQVGGSPTLSHMLIGYFPLDPVMLYKAVLKKTNVIGVAPVSISGSTAFNGYVHQVEAVVGAHAVLQSAGDVKVDAESVNYSQAVANGKVLIPKVGIKLLAASTAVAMGSFDNTVRATVEGGARVDAIGAVEVNAALSYPDMTKFLPFNPERFQIGDPDNGDWMAELGEALNGRGGLD